MEHQEEEIGDQHYSPVLARNNNSKRRANTREGLYTEASLFFRQFANTLQNFPTPAYDSVMSQLREIHNALKNKKSFRVVIGMLEQLKLCSSKSKIKVFTGEDQLSEDEVEQQEMTEVAPVITVELSGQLEMALSRTEKPADSQTQEPRLTDCTITSPIVDVTRGN